MTLAQFGELVRTSSSHLSKVERGEAQAGEELVKRILAQVGPLPGDEPEAKSEEPPALAAAISDLAAALREMREDRQRLDDLAEAVKVLAQRALPAPGSEAPGGPTPPPATTE